MKKINTITEKIDLITEKSMRLIKEIESFRGEILNDSEIPEELKNGLIEIIERHKKEDVQLEKYLEANKHRKIIGYDTETFLPIYE